MSRLRRSLLVVLAVGLITGAIADTRLAVPVTHAAPTPNGYTLVQDVTTATFNRMVDFALIPGTTGEAVVVSQSEARVRRVSLTGAFSPTLYGNLSDRVKVAGNEEGLLSIAFSPNFASDGRVYVYYTSLTCQPGVARCSRISRFPVVNSPPPARMDETQETVVLEIPQLPSDQSNHNGGRLLFGPDGYLYLSIGDGGGAGDPNDTGQRKNDLLGSMLRINVTGQQTYTIPPGNPFADGPGGNADELWVYGLRNPWRYSFDRLSGDLWLADVGQSLWEEVEKIVGGGNYGWDCYEGNELYNDPSQSQPCIPPFLFPRAVYGHNPSCSVTGGYVYRGALLPEIYGWYVYGDYCSGIIWAVNPADTSNPVQLVDSAFNIVSFGELPNGELLVLTFQNAIYRLACGATPDTDGDGIGNACDPDDDNDKWNDVPESVIGTDPLDACANTPAPNDEADDRWPADLNDDRFSDGTDITIVAGSFGKAVPSQAPPRRDVAPMNAPDGFVDGTDITVLAGFFGKGCGP